MGEINSLTFGLDEIHTDPKLDIGTIFSPRSGNFAGNKYRYVKNVSGAALAAKQLVTGVIGYDTGTLTTVLDSKVITGAGTTFTAAMAGRTIHIAGVKYVIEKFVSTTVLHLTEPYKVAGAALVLFCITASGEVSDVGGGEDNGAFQGIAISAIADDGYGFVCIASEEGVDCSMTAGVSAGDSLAIGLTLYLDTYANTAVDIPVGVALQATTAGLTAVCKIYDLTG
jgi:hypothetical protein